MNFVDGTLQYTSRDPFRDDFHDKLHIRLRDRAGGSTFESFGKEREEENRAQKDAHVLLVEVKVEWEKEALAEAHVVVVEVPEEVEE
jgi:hypothetical protein